MEQKTKEQLLKESVSRFHELVNYDFKPKGFGFGLEGNKDDEIKEKLIIKEGINPEVVKEIKAEIAELEKNKEQNKDKNANLKNKLFTLTGGGLNEKTLKEEFIELAEKHGLKEAESIYETWNFEKKKTGEKKDDDSEKGEKKDSKKKVVKKENDKKEN